jgi:hypothetical protein
MQCFQNGKTREQLTVDQKQKRETDARPRHRTHKRHFCSQNRRHVESSRLYIGCERFTCRQNAGGRHIA